MKEADLVVGVGEEPRKVPHGASSKHGPRAIVYSASEAPRRGRRLDERGRRRAGLGQRRDDRRHDAQVRVLLLLPVVGSYLTV